jgi:hypothetical protein
MKFCAAEAASEGDLRASDVLLIGDCVSVTEAAVITLFLYEYSCKLFIRL